jgi:hypothetical protein
MEDGGVKKRLRNAVTTKFFNAYAISNEFFAILHFHLVALQTSCNFPFVILYFNLVSFFLYPNCQYLNICRNKLELLVMVKGPGMVCP